MGVLKVLDLPEHSFRSYVFVYNGSLGILASFGDCIEEQRSWRSALLSLGVFFLGIPRTAGCEALGWNLVLNAMDDVRKSALCRRLPRWFSSVVFMMTRSID